MQIEWSRHIMMAGALPFPAQSGAEQTGGVLRLIGKVVETGYKETAIR